MSKRALTWVILADIMLVGTVGVVVFTQNSNCPVEDGHPLRYTISSS